MLALARRTTALLLVLSLGHILLISVQVQSRRGLPVAQTVAFGAFAKVQQLFASMADGLGDLWSNYVALRGIVQENGDLRRRMLDLEARLRQAEAQATQTAALERTLGLSQSLPVPTVAARVIAGAPSPGSYTITIDRGADAGVQTDMPVIAPAGLVGRVINTPLPGAAQVQLLVDRNAHAAVYFERTGAGGIVGGGGEPPLRIEFVPGTADVAVGDRVLTSGQDGIYPRGFLIGTVVRADLAGAVWTVAVQPAVEFSHIDFVLVMLEKLPAPPVEGGTP